MGLNTGTPIYLKQKLLHLNISCWDFYFVDIFFLSQWQKKKFICCWLLSLGPEVLSIYFNLGKNLHTTLYIFALLANVLADC